MDKLTMGLKPNLIGLIIIISLSLYVTTAKSESCYVFGTEHLLTYDNVMLEIVTSCSLTLTRTCTGNDVHAVFSVVLENQYFDDISKDELSQAKCVELDYGGYAVRLCADQTITLEGELVTSAWTANKTLMLYQGTTGVEAAIHVPSSTEVVQISISPSSTVTVRLPASYMNKMCGICGNYDGDKSNDLRLADGTLSSQGVNDRINYIAQSYVAPNFVCDSIYRYNYSNCQGVVLNNVKVDLMDAEYCAVYENTDGIFGTCVSNEGALSAEFLSACQQDFCEAYLTGMEGSGDCLSDNSCQLDVAGVRTALNYLAEVYVDECRVRSYELADWRQEYSADLNCSVSDQSYSFTNDKCPDVCGLPSDRCTPTNEDGCSCADGLYLDVDQCVTVDVCGCLDPVDGSYHKVGETWVDATCSLQFSCVSSSDVQQTQVKCHSFGTCQRTMTASGSYSYMCACQQNYEGNGITSCELFCPAGEQPDGNNMECLECPVGTYKAVPSVSRCTSCPDGQVTDGTGSTDVSQCEDIVMIPDSVINPECIHDVYDLTKEVIIPGNILPDGIPFGARHHTHLYVSTNGLISFTDQFFGRDPVSVADDEEGAFLGGSTFTQTVVAPLWFRQDLRRFSEDDYSTTRLCINEYSTIHTNEAFRTESKERLQMIDIMLKNTTYLDDLEYESKYALVTTWHNSLPYPYVWYDQDDYKENATYQSVISTDGLLTFIIFIYPSGDIHLRYLNSFRHIYMGYNAQDDVNQFNLFVSAEAAITGIDKIVSNIDVLGRWIFQVANAEQENPAAKLCVDWYEQQQEFQRYRLLLGYGLGSPGSEFSYDPWTESIPCPCNRFVAQYDENFYYIAFESCAYSLSKFGGFLYQTCCYNLNGTLITDPRISGFPSSYNRLLDNDRYEVFDSIPRDWCCSQSDYCELFTEFRKTPTCENYEKPTLACGFGDPHVLTFDEVIYTFNPIGEFWMMQGLNFSIQGRMGRTLFTEARATQFLAFALQQRTPASDIIQVEVNSFRTDFKVYKTDADGSVINLTPQLDSQISDNLIQFDGGVIKKYNGSISVAFDLGYVVRLSLGNEILSTQVTLPKSANGTIAGLLGVFDGDDTNDMTSRDGDIVCSGEECDLRTIHYQFGETWRITQEESLFAYHQADWNTNTFTDRTFVPMFVVQMNDTVVADCDNNFQCIFDAEATNTTSIGIYTADVQREATDKVVAFANTAPYLIGLSSLNTTLGMPVTAFYEFGDLDDNNTRLIIVEASPESEFIIEDVSTLGLNQYSITWTPTNLTIVPRLRMYAEEMGVMNRLPQTSSEISVLFHLAPACTNGEMIESQVAPGGYIDSLFKIVVCSCQIGWEGEVCSDDIDGCKDDPCYLSKCTDTPAENATESSPLYKCEAIECEIGYERTQNMNSTVDECFDIDECVDPNKSARPCPLDRCINTKGSFICTCEDGFSNHPLINNGTDACVNIDECASYLDGCSDICTDNAGSYVCSCHPGFTLSADNHTCQPITAQDTLCNGLNCSYACINNTENVEVCACPRNQVLTIDKTTCSNLNECADNSTNACVWDSGAVCEDTESAYDCTCPTVGYERVNTYTCKVCDSGKFGPLCSQTCSCGDRAQKCDNILGCTDCYRGWTGDQCSSNLDECQNNPCPANSTCADTTGSYTCTCNTGLQHSVRNGEPICENINECKLQDPCTGNSQCVDTLGSYKCECLTGYRAAGDACIDINECADSALNDCYTADACRNTLGGYGCVCEPGYHGDGKRTGSGCEDDDECTDAVAACPVSNTVCDNLPGKYQCLCVDGYEGNGAIRCDNINECERDTSICGERRLCTDRVPGFDCSCEAGYIGNFADICVDINECLDPKACLETEQCLNTEGSHDCYCRSGYTSVPAAIGSGTTCEDVNECTNSTACPGANNMCENLQGDFLCTCRIGYTGDVCDIRTNSIIGVEQVLSLREPDPTTLSEEQLEAELQDILDKLHEDLDGFLGTFIIDIVRNGRIIDIQYDIVLANGTNSTDIPGITVANIHESNYVLVSSNGAITVIDLVQLKYGGVPVTCANINCISGDCYHGADNYPLCSCMENFDGWNCAVDQRESIENVNLLPLWISVGVAAALLTLGCSVCIGYVAWRRRRRRRPRIHRYPRIFGVRGPILFNPTSRMPAEAYNYQFPSGSIQDTENESIVSSSSSSSRSISSRIGLMVPFAPRWPKAYHSQVGSSVHEEY